jgi:hypothetical protein
MPTLAVTAGQDGKFKIWVLNEKQGVTGKIRNMLLEMDFIYIALTLK